MLSKATYLDYDDKIPLIDRTSSSMWSFGYPGVAGGPWPLGL